MGLAALVREETSDGLDLVRRFKAIWEGKAVMMVGPEGEERPVRPSWRDVIAAGEWLADRGYGKPTQPLEVGGEGGGPVPVSITIIRKVRE